MPRHARNLYATLHSPNIVLQCNGVSDKQCTTDISERHFSAKYVENNVQPIHFYRLRGERLESHSSRSSRRIFIVLDSFESTSFRLDIGLSNEPYTMNILPKLTVLWLSTCFALKSLTIAIDDIFLETQHRVCASCRS